MPPKWGTAVCGETLLCKNRSGGPLSSSSASKAVAAEIKRPADDQFEHIGVVTDVVLSGHEEESEMNEYDDYSSNQTYIGLPPVADFVDPDKIQGVPHTTLPNSDVPSIHTTLPPEPSSMLGHDGISYEASASEVDQYDHEPVTQRGPGSNYLTSSLSATNRPILSDGTSPTSLSSPPLLPL